MFYHYWFYLVVRCLYSTLDYFCGLVFCYFLSKGPHSQRNKSDEFENCAHVANILWRNQMSVFDDARLDHFLLRTIYRYSYCRHVEYTHPKIIFTEKVTLLSIDKDYALFVKCDVECHKHEVGAFFYQSQFNLSTQLITVPLRHFVKLMQTEAPSVDHFNLTVITNTGRCGSTLIMDVLEKRSDSVCINETSILTVFIARYDLGGLFYSRAELLKACIDVLCLSSTREGGEKNVVFKPKGQAVFMTSEMAELYPDLKHLLLFRHPVEYVKSLRAIVYSFLPPILYRVMPRVVMFFLKIYEPLINFIHNHFREKGSYRAKMMYYFYTKYFIHDIITRCASIYAANILSTQELAQNYGIKFLVISYHELVENFERYLPIITEHCKIKLNTNAAKTLPENDSQANSPLGRQALKNYRKTLTNNEILDVDIVLRSCRLPECDEFPFDSQKFKKVLVLE